VSETTSAGAIRFAPRVAGMKVSPTIAVMDQANGMIARGIDVIDLGPGEPDFATPASVAAAGQKAIASGYTKYTNALGSNELRKAIADRYNRRHGATVGAQNVIAGTGGKQALFNVIMALVSEGDEVVIPSPYWVSYPDQVAFAGGRPVFAPAERASGFRPTLEAIAAVTTSRTRGVILNSPCNPTGAVISETQLGSVIEFCHGRGLFLIFDETYEFFVYDGKEHVSAARWFDQYPATVIVVNSMSKTFAMTGWRIGFAIAHPSIVATSGKIQSHSTSNPCSISQAAAVDALNGDDSEVARMHAAYTERRAWLVPAINAIEGFRCDAPDGSFYLFPSVADLYGSGGISDSTSFAAYLLDRAHVAVVPGIAFGDDCSVRISYAVSLERLREAVRRIGEAIGGLRS
jgi:aspartate aminotransferase